jgi:endonuclease/exonuclease/phosphatase family metal-dependent hydrolase
MLRPLSFLLCAIMCISSSAFSQPIIVGTYNLRYDNPADSGNLWKDRMPVVASLIRFNKFDILGTQEGLENQLADLSAAMPEYERCGVGRDDGKQAGEHSAIFFRKDRFEIIDKGNFWLSETPDRPSKGWDAKCCNRLCTWVELRDKQMANQSLYVYNVHFDHQGVQARRESARLMDSVIRKKTGYANVILMGDFNSGRQSDAYQLFENGWISDTYKKAEIIHGHNPSFNNFGKNLESAEVIDHIFVSSTFEVNRWGIIGDSYHGKYPSDHFPVLTELEYKIERN